MASYMQEGPSASTILNVFVNISTKVRCPTQRRCPELYMAIREQVGGEAACQLLDMRVKDSDKWVSSGNLRKTGKGAAEYLLGCSELCGLLDGLCPNKWLYCAVLLGTVTCIGLFQEDVKSLSLEWNWMFSP